MPEVEINSVNDAFSCLIKMVEQQIDDLRNSTARQLNAGKLDKVKESIDLMEALVEYKERLQELKADYPKPGQKGRGKRSQRRRKGTERLPAGQSTPSSAFFNDILSILRDEGGMASPALVIPQIESRMKDLLKEEDFERVQSSNKPRWIIAVRKARGELIEQGLLKENSPRGMWELSDKGWQVLEKKDPKAMLKVMDGRQKSTTKSSASKRQDNK